MSSGEKTVDERWDDEVRRARFLNAKELEWALLCIDFRRADNHFTNWLLDLDEPDAIGFERRIALLEEKAQKVAESDRKGTRHAIRQCKKDYYRKFPSERPSLRQRCALMGQKIGALVRSFGGQHPQ